MKRSVRKKLMRLAKRVVSQVTSQLTQQVKVVQDAALQPIRQVIAQVTGGVWRGRGADAFVAELSTLMVPGIGRVAQEITTVHQDVATACEVMERADAQARSAASSLRGAFKFFR